MYTKRKMLPAFVLLVITILWIMMITLLNLPTGSYRPGVMLPKAIPTNRKNSSVPNSNRSKPPKANQLLRAQNTSYSKLNLIYDRIVLPENNCSGVFISVRTTTKYHESRLMLLLHTWLQTIDPKQVGTTLKSS